MSMPRSIQRNSFFFTVVPIGIVTISAGVTKLKGYGNHQLYVFTTNYQIVHDTKQKNAKQLRYILFKKL